MPALIDPVFKSALEKKFNILDEIRLWRFDQNFEDLQQRLQKLREKKEFLPNDRILVNHFDTDYFVHNQFGINIFNLFTVWDSVDLPRYLMLLYTNHLGIGREIDMICKYTHHLDRPTVFETFIDPMSYSHETYSTEPDIDIESIEHHGIAMMNAPRTHRYALYNHIRHLDKKLVITIRTQNDYNKDLSRN